MAKNNDRQKLQNLFTTGSTAPIDGDGSTLLFDGEIAVQQNDNEACIYVNGEGGIAKIPSEKKVTSLIVSKVGIDSLPEGYANYNEYVQDSILDVKQTVEAEITVKNVDDSGSIDLTLTDGVVTGEVTNVDADITKTIEPITIAGGPLDNEATRAMYPGGIIPEGTDLQGLLQALFCKELFVEPQLKKAFTVNIASPSVSTTPSGSIAEVGENFSLTASLGQSSSVQNYEVCGTTYGYKLNSAEAAKQDGTRRNTFTPTPNEGSRAMNASFIGFGGKTPETGETSLSISGVVIGEGTNTVTVSYTGTTYTPQTNITPETVYALSNLGKSEKADGSENTVSVPANLFDSYSATAATGSVKRTVTGYRKYFYGQTNDHSDLTSSFIRGLNGSTEACNSGKEQIMLLRSGAGNRVIVACPSQFTVKSCKKENADADIATEFSLTKMQIEGANGYASAEYNVYEHTWESADPFDDKNYIITFE